MNKFIELSMKMLSIDLKQTINSNANYKRKNGNKIEAHVMSYKFSVSTNISSSNKQEKQTINKVNRKYLQFKHRLGPRTKYIATRKST